LSIQLPIDFSPVADVDNKYSHASILDPDDYPETADTIPPEAFRLTLERFPDPSRIFRDGDSLVKKPQNPHPIAFREFA
jgi:hypothetical protein